MVTVIVTFVMLAAVVAGAGTALAGAADAIAEANRPGRLLVGSILLAVATSLPELTVDVAAVGEGHADLAAGDLLGSSLMNLLILAGIDLSQRIGRRMLFIDQRISARLAAEEGPSPAGQLWKSAVAFGVVAVILVAAGPRRSRSADSSTMSSGGCRSSSPTPCS